MKPEELKMGPVYWATHKGERGFLYYREATATWVWERQWSDVEPVDVTTEQIAAMTKIQKI